jgi:hypothetical protein
MSKKESFGSVSLVRQGDHRFYSFTMHSDILAETCYVINRDEDPIEGFQRELGGCSEFCVTFFKNTNALYLLPT